MNKILTQEIDNLKINGLIFTAFLEDSQEAYEFVKANVPNTSVSEKNNSVTTRVLRKVKFIFNVIAEDIDQCKKNYKNLEILIKEIKPKYKIYEDHYIPSINNLNGLTKIKFSKLALTNPGVDVQITNFSYEINKELGYLENKDILYPISFKISIDARVPQFFSEQANIFESNIKLKILYKQPTPPTSQVQEVQQPLDTPVEEDESVIVVAEGGNDIPQMKKKQAKKIYVQDLGLRAYSSALDKLAKRDTSISPSYRLQQFEQFWSENPSSIEYIFSKGFYIKDENVWNELKKNNLIPEGLDISFKKDWNLWSVIPVFDEL